MIGPEVFSAERIDVSHMTESEVIEYCDSNAIRIENFFTPEGTHRCELCADARHIGDERASYPGAFFGGDFGRIIQLIALRNRVNGQNEKGKIKRKDAALARLDNTEILGIVAQSVGGLHNIRFHIDEDHGQTDFLFIIEHGLQKFLTHKVNQRINIGCGHINEVLNSPIAYGLTLKDRDFLIETLIFIYKRNVEHERDNGNAKPSTAFPIMGKHQERAIVVLDSNKYTLNTRVKLPDGSEQQVFLVHKTFGEGVEDNLFEKLERYFDDGFDFTKQQIRQELTKIGSEHIDLTREALPSAKNLNIWYVKINDDTGKVEHIERVKTKK